MKLCVVFGQQNLKVCTGTPIVRDNADFPVYDGEYEVIPKKDEQTVLETQGKVLVNDVTVLEIPYQAVGNLSGGKTAIIGGI